MPHPPLTILILNPYRRLESSLPELLRENGYAVEVISGQLPLPAQISAHNPGAILVEVGNDSSLDLIRTLHAHSATRTIPIIAMSAQRELEYELLDLFDFLSTPINFARLLDNLAWIACNRQSRNPVECPPLGSEDLTWFQTFLVQHSGLHFDQSNSKILERGLCRRLRALRLEHYRDYGDYLERYQDSRQELKKLLGLLTVGETFFFRYRAHFEALQHVVIPELIKRNRSRRVLRIWSAGCSTGEEPYSLAMMLLEKFPELVDWEVHILATDINYQALRQAREGLYGKRSLRSTEAEYRERYFIPVGDRFVVAPEVRNLVQFSHLNLQTGLYPSANNGTNDVDLLFCRNVMIYFRQETNRKIIERFSRCLRPDGFLFLGHAETLQNLSAQFSSVHCQGGFYYRLLSAPLPLPKVEAVVAQQKPVAAAERLAAAEQPVEVKSDFMLEGAQKAFEREDFVLAEKHFAMVLRQQENQEQALLGMGFIRANQARYEEALDFCNRVLVVNDLSPEAYFLRGLIFEAQQEVVAAVEEYRKALLLDLDFIMPHYNLSRIFQRLAQPREASRELNNTMRLLEQTTDEVIIPHSGGLSRAVFLEICRQDFSLLDVDVAVE